MAITLFGSTASPTDNGTSTATQITLTPPSSMTTGDLVFVECHQRGTATFSVGVTGGQSWNSLTRATSATSASQAFWCRYNGTWGANPRFDFSEGVNTNAVMLVFRPSDTAKLWAVDVAQDITGYTAPGSPAQIQLTGQTRAGASSVAIAYWTSVDDNTWGSLSGTGWSKTNLSAQYRNTSGSDMSATFAYNIGSGATNNVSQKQTALESDSGVKSIVSFYEYDDIQVSATRDALTLTEYAATVAINVAVAASADSLSLVERSATVEVTGASTEVSATADALTLTEQSASVSVDQDIEAVLFSYGLYLWPATVAVDENIAASADSLTLTEISATVSIDVSVSASVDALAVTEYPASLSVDTAVAAQAEALTLTTYAASLDQIIEVQSGTVSLAITPSAALIAVDQTVAASRQILTVATHAAAVTSDVGVQSSSVSLSVATYQASLAADADIGAGVDHLTLTEHAAWVTADQTIAAGSASLTIVTHRASVLEIINLQALSNALTLTEHPAYVAEVGDVNIATSPDVLVLAEYAARVRHLLSDRSAQISRDSRRASFVGAGRLIDAGRSDRIIYPEDESRTNSAGIDARTATTRR